MILIGKILARLVSQSLQGLKKLDFYKNFTLSIAFAIAFVPSSVEK